MQGVDGVVHQNERRKQPQRKHRSRHGVADAGDVHAAGDDRMLRVAQRRDRQEADHQRDRGRGRGERHRCQCIADEIGVETREQPAPDHLAQEIARRQQEAEHDRQEAGACSDPSPGPRERDPRRQLAIGAQRGKIPALPSVAFEHDQRGNDQQQEAGHLRRAGEASTIEPGGEDRERQGLHAEILAGADVIERLEQGQRSANGNRGSRQRKGDAPRKLPWLRAQHARGFGKEASLGSETSRERRGRRKDRARN